MLYLVADAAAGHEDQAYALTLGELLFSMAKRERADMASGAALSGGSAPSGITAVRRAAAQFSASACRNVEMLRCARGRVPDIAPMLAASALAPTSHELAMEVKWDAADLARGAVDG